jgi:UDP-glucose 4-epimerase
MNILVTGGAGYIGSTICHKLKDHKFSPIILDDLSTGALSNIKGMPFFKGDIADPALLDAIVAEHGKIEAVVHCAAKIVVPESVDQPINYYQNNVARALSLVENLLERGIDKFILSGTASIYAPKTGLVANENTEVCPMNPYSRSKYLLEQMLTDIAKATPLKFLSLRYFNPIGCDGEFRSGYVGKNPTHLLGSLIRAYQTGGEFSLTGTDWETRDGTAIRDYVDVGDLAEAHLLAVQKFDKLDFAKITNKDHIATINLGTGEGVTVKEFVAAFCEAINDDLKIKNAPPRPGDVIGTYTDPTLAQNLLGWRASVPLKKSIQNSIAFAKSL